MLEKYAEKKQGEAIKLLKGMLDDKNIEEMLRTKVIL